MSFITTGQGDMIIAPRAISQVPVVQGDPQADFNLSIIEKELEEAIKHGDNLGPQNSQGEGIQVDRRALIIAPGYADYGIEDTPSLAPATAGDARLAYKMLTQFGYEPQNIRILCDTIPGHENTYPTVKNILASLDWLTSNVPPGGHRYLHFSGHGVNRPSKDKEGKLIRKPDVEVFNDTERAENWIFGRKVEEITAKGEEMGYYNEAIAGRNEAGQHNLEDVLIYDKTLNEFLSKLPENCTITNLTIIYITVHPGHLPTKVEGGGFRAIVLDSLKTDDDASRGKGNQAVVAPSLEQDASKLGPGNGGATAASIEGESPPIGVTLDSHWSTLQPLLHDTIPDREKKMNHIKANIIFTDTCQTLGGRHIPHDKFTYRQLYEDVSHKVTDKRSQAQREALIESKRTGEKPRHTYPQFVQLWSSLGDDEPATKAKLLDSAVEI
ncbi:hypothetical protein B0J17DRAFT_709667 [Rhizoctonia solani]|nr:hypothetical protein B0J17DRAFT_709667 [Rhizoctonia solani]